VCLLLYLNGLPWLQSASAWCAYSAYQHELHVVASSDYSCRKVLRKVISCMLAPDSAEVGKE
jgi:hypothetical protein